MWLGGMCGALKYVHELAKVRMNICILRVFLRTGETRTQSQGISKAERHHKASRRPSDHEEQQVAATNWIRTIKMSTKTRKKK